jgi:hypothetical protein
MFKKMGSLFINISLMILIIGMPVLARTDKGPNIFEMNYDQFFFDYKEDLPAPYKSTERGWLPGVNIRAVWDENNRPLRSILSLKYVTADTDYDGTTQSGIPVKDKTNNSIFDFEARVDFVFFREEAFQQAIYSGLEFISWQRSLGGDWPYNEVYSWFNLPIGYCMEKDLGSGWSIGFDAALLMMFAGNMQLNLPFLNRTADMALGNKMGWRVKVPIKWEVFQGCNFTIIPWYQYSAIGQSEPFKMVGYDYVLEGYEPASKTNQFGVQLGLRVDVR